MAKHIGPKKKYLRRFGLLPGKSRQEKLRAKSEYGKRLEEKQKLKFIYGVTEKQFLRHVRNAQKSRGNYGELVLQQLEARLDNVVYRLGYAKTREQARQIVSHEHVLVDDKKVTIPSYQVSAGQKIAIKEKMFQNPLIQDAMKEKKIGDLPGWLERKESSAIIRHFPQSDDLPKDINMSLILEFYR
ncbi:MAG: hypothetical protein ACD_15C00151G0010 [uncultured bacterium]|nr:MAG: hypothetical protein ACD_15C00151G0010 [uncultured bacterium]HCU70619.1 30S ribosomal protein S4 [Candidatus Moranbacteria bacterium]